MFYTITWLYLIVQVVFTEQNKEYELVVDRGELEFINKKAVDGYAYFYPFNRTVKALNASFTISHDPPEKTRISIAVYKQSNNIYVAIPIKINLPLREALLYEVFDVKNCLQSFTPPLFMPIKGSVTYAISNYIVNVDNYPDKLIPGKFKTVIEILAPSIGTKSLTKYVIFNYFLEIKYGKTGNVG